MASSIEPPERHGSTVPVESHIHPELGGLEESSNNRTMLLDQVGGRRAGMPFYHQRERLKGVFGLLQPLSLKVVVCSLFFLVQI